MSSFASILSNSWNHFFEYCECVGKIWTDLDEKCVTCNRCLNPLVICYCFFLFKYYCYSPTSCRFFKSDLTKCPSDKFHCPLKSIDSCPWIGYPEDIWRHCSVSHPQNCFVEEAIISSSAHLKKIQKFHIYTCSFLILFSGRLFRCSFEIRSNGTHRWCVTKLEIEDETVNENFVFLLQFRPLNTEKYEVPLMAQCLSNSETLFKYPNKEIVVPKHSLQKYQFEGEIQYRICINLTSNGEALPTYWKIAGRTDNFWKDCKCPKETRYEIYCKCVKNMD